MTGVIKTFVFWPISLTQPEGSVEDPYLFNLKGPNGFCYFDLLPFGSILIFNVIITIIK